MINIGGNGRIQHCNFNCEAGGILDNQTVVKYQSRL